eukprot:5000276-Pyramimonas_sp.AAC.1
MGARESVILGSSWKDYCEYAERKCKFSWDSYFWQNRDDAEVQAELEWARTRAAVIAETETAEGMDLRSHLSEFEAALSNWEIENLRRYQELEKDGIYTLGQHALKHAHYSRHKSTMHTIIKHPDLHFSNKHKRWLTPKELLTIHNYPMISDASQFRLQSSFQVDRASKCFGPRSRTQVLSQIGNGMSLCTENLGIAYIVSVLSACCPIAAADCPSWQGGSLISLAMTGGPVHPRDSGADDRKRRRVLSKRPSS